MILTHDRAALRGPVFLLTAVLFLAGNGMRGTAAAAGKKSAGKYGFGSSAKREERAYKQAGKRLQKARALREKEKNELAIAEYKEVLKADPTLVEAYFDLAELYAEVGIPEKAVEMLETGLPLAEQQQYDAVTLGEAWCRLASSYQARQDLDKATGALVKAAALMPQDPAPQKILGDIQAGRDHLDAAMTAYRTAVQLDPQHAETWWALGQLGLANKKPAVVQEAYEGLLRADSDRAAEFATQMRLAKLKPLPVKPAAALPPGAEEDPYGNLQPQSETPVPAGSPVKVGTASAAASPHPGASRRAGGVPPPPNPHPPKTQPMPKTASGSVGNPPEVVDDPYGEGAVDPVAGASTAAPSGGASPATGPFPPPKPKAASLPAAPVPTVQATASGAVPPAAGNPLDEMLIRLYGDDEEQAEVAKSQVIALGAEALPALEKGLKDGNPDRRLRSLQVLASFGTAAQSSVPAIEEAMNDADPDVAAAAQAALQEINPY